ncbi:hypothetical protein FN846DRAFT_78461 [Sphaerosporella brunnea]|uniref:Uncharacterized protein n=1 Tax=Sphaerosporella brunnea TaxID=1250544 RepID=A0A5J5F960_9PEZI|nr:hypothetical protein FN846DRAFT_78461 [Sphaerosporella brunnea]
MRLCRSFFEHPGAHWYLDVPLSCHTCHCTSLIACCLAAPTAALPPLPPPLARELSSKAAAVRVSESKRPPIHDRPRSPGEVRNNIGAHSDNPRGEGAKTTQLSSHSASHAPRWLRECLLQRRQHSQGDGHYWLGLSVATISPVTITNGADIPLDPSFAVIPSPSVSSDNQNPAPPSNRDNAVANFSPCK